jgi:hypothetical protein
VIARAVYRLHKILVAEDDLPGVASDAGLFRAANAKRRYP